MSTYYNKKQYTKLYNAALYAQRTYGSDHPLAKKATTAFYKSKAWSDFNRGVKRKPSKKRWIQHAVKKKNKGALHRQLNIPTGQKIPTLLLRQVLKAPHRFSTSKTKSALTRLKRRAQFALNVRKLGKKKKRKRD